MQFDGALNIDICVSLSQNCGAGDLHLEAHLQALQADYIRPSAHRARTDHGGSMSGRTCAVFTYCFVGGFFPLLYISCAMQRWQPLWYITNTMRIVRTMAQDHYL